jgi:hypothetical protein
MNVELNIFFKNPNLFLVGTPSKNLNMARMNPEDEKLA